MSPATPIFPEDFVRAFWSKLAVELPKRAGLVAAVGLLITAVLGFGITKLEFATGQDSYLNASDQVAKDNVEYQKLFGGQIMVVLFTMEDGHKVEDLAKAENRKQLAEAKAELEKNPHIKTVLSPIDTMQFSQNILLRSPENPTEDPETLDFASATGSIGARTLNWAETTDTDPQAHELRKADFAKTTERIAPFLDSPDKPGAERSFDNPEWVKMLLYGNDGEIRKPLSSSYFDSTHAQMIVRMKGNASIEEEGAGAMAVKAAFADRTIEGASVVITGAPVLLKDINDYLRGGILSLGALAVAIMIIILLVFFDVRWRLLPLGVVLIGVVWAFGMAGYLGIPLSVVTIAGLPVMLGVGVDYAIQMHTRIEEEVVIDRAAHPIQETARQLSPALLVVTFDAIFAFAALRFAKVPMIRDFAMLLVIGIALICFNSIVQPLAILGVREFRSPTKGRDFREGALGRLVVWLGDLPTKSAVPIILASVVIFGGGLAVEGKLTLQTDPVQWVNQQSQNRKDIATLEHETQASSELGVYITADNADLFLADVAFKATGNEDVACQQGEYPKVPVYKVGGGCYSTDDAAKLGKADRSIRWLEDFTDDAMVRYEDQLLVASSILSPLADLTDLEGASNVVPPAPLLNASYLAAPRSVQQMTVTDTREALNLLFITKPDDLAHRAVMIDDMRERLELNGGEDGARPPAGISATPSGLAVVGVGLLENLESNRVQLTYLSIFLVFAFLTVRLKSAVRSLLSLVPVLIAVGMASLVAYAFSLKL
ncbi:MAG: MMPL family transporter, partial [Acidimicrobiales bacterium]|nr:MMPL family transporter [Acidimicrobiales bacterium]